MNISALTTSLVSPSTSVAPTSAVGASTSATGVDADGDHDGDKTKMSKMGQLMSKLQDLEKSDPAQAKQVLTNIASQLKSQADSSGDSKLAALADKFNQAAQTGDLSALAPKGGHGHHHHGAGASSASSGAAPSSPPAQAASYAQNGSDPMAQVESVIQSALDGSASSTAS